MILIMTGTIIFIHTSYAQHFARKYLVNAMVSERHEAAHSRRCLPVSHQTRHDHHDAAKGPNICRQSSVANEATLSCDRCLTDNNRDQMRKSRLTQYI